MNAFIIIKLYNCKAVITYIMSLRVFFAHRLTTVNSSPVIPKFFLCFSRECGVFMNLVIVESPAKAKTIEKYLGKDYKVLASFGHIRDLPSKTGSVRPDEDFAMDWDVDSRAKKRITDIVNALKGSDKLILATDPDREGEAISWHLLEILAKKKALKDKQIERVVFNAITKKICYRCYQSTA